MTIAELFNHGIAVALTGILCWAGICDIRLSMIPNTAVVAVIGLFGLWAAGHSGQAVVSGLISGTVMFVVMTMLYARGFVGGGDAKLLSAVALFAGLGHLLDYLAITAISGGVIALFELGRQPQRAMLMFLTRHSVDHGPRVPYGVAIAVGGTLLIWSQIGVLPSGAEVRAWVSGL